VEDFMLEKFGVEPSSFNIKQMDTDYWGTYYSFEIINQGGW